MFHIRKVCSKFLSESTRFIIFLLILIFWISELKAEPGQGFGLGLSGGSLKPLNAVTGNDFQSSDSYGLSVDYQWFLGQAFSFSIMGFEHGGEAKLPPKSDYEYYKMGLISAELKVWIGYFFIGFHRGQSYLVWLESLVPTTMFEFGRTSGSGYSLGFETESGWMFVANSEKSGNFENEDMPDQKLEGNRILLGYRWR